MKQVKGQLDLFPSKKINTANEVLGEPCLYCDVEWCSAICFIRRGYLLHPGFGFEKDSEGNKLRISIENRDCKEIRFDSRKAKKGE